MYDDYHETNYTNTEVAELFEKYLLWCEQNNQTPEVTELEHVDESNIGHVAYHAKMVS